MTQEIDKEVVFWQAMTALQEAITEGYIDVKRDMPDLYNAISQDVESNLRSELDIIRNQYAKQGSDFINRTMQENLNDDKQAYKQLFEEFSTLEWAITHLETRLECISDEQSYFKVKDWGIKVIIAIGFVMVSLSSLAILATLINLFAGATIKEVWSQVYLGAFSLEQPTWQGALSVIIKLLVSLLLLAIGALFVISPWFAFTWLLAKLPHRFRKSFGIDRYAGR